MSAEPIDSAKCLLLSAGSVSAGIRKIRKMHKMATRRSGKVDTAARDVESPEDARTAADEVDDKNKPIPRRFKCVHALVIITVLVMSLDAYLQMNESRTNAPSAAEAVANAVKTTPEATIAAPNLESLEGLPAVPVAKGAQTVETGNAPTQDLEEPQPQQSHREGSDPEVGREGRAGGREIDPRKLDRAAAPPTKPGNRPPVRPLRAQALTWT